MAIKIPPSSRTQEAVDTPMEKQPDRDNDFKAENVQDGLEEIDFRRETKDPTGFLNLDESTVSFDGGTLTFTIAPVSTEFVYYIKGCRFEITIPKSATITNTSGTWFFYLDDSEVLIATQNHLDFGENVTPAGHVYWNAVTQEDIWFGDVRTNLAMTWGAKRRVHEVDRVEGRDSDFIIHDTITDGDGTLDAHAQISILDGDLYHADIKRSVVDAAVPAADWEQHLLNIAQIPIYYRDGADLMYKKAANNFALIEDAGNLIFFNEEVTPGNWQLTNASNNQFVAVYLFITMDPRHPVVGLLGNISASSPSKSLDPSMLIPTGDAFASFGFLKALIFQTSTGFTNSVKARLFAVSDVVDTLSTDRYVVQAWYGGNANNGRILEISPAGADSEEEPLLIPEDSLIRTVTVQADANIGINKSVGFYKDGGATLVFTVVIPFGGQKEHIFEVTESFLKGDRIAVKIVNGNIRKPTVRFWIETNL
tara:strand:- start:2116 stop:3555 length:1440 start_codon:yes stop_codon:yes gene_type:complete